MNKMDFSRGFVEEELDKISSRGQKVGRSVKSVFEFAKKFAIIAWVLLGFGIIVFIWSVIKGFRDKK